MCPNNRRSSFKRYSYRIDKYNYQCDLFNLCRKNAYQTTNKKIMKNNVRKYFKHMTQNLLSIPETEKIYKQRKIDVEAVFEYLKAILGFTRMSLREKSKIKRELGIALKTTNIRKMVALRATKKTLKMKYSGNLILLMNFHCIFTF
nr:transposase [Staphylococcus kloosii]